MRESDPAQVEEEFAGKRYGEFKTAVAQALVERLAPVRERYAELRADADAIESILAEGAARAQSIAAETLADVREHMGVGAPRRARSLP